MADEAMILRSDNAVRSEIARRPGANPQISKASVEYTLPLAIPLAGRTYQPRYRLHPCESLLCLLARRPTLLLAVLMLWSTLPIPSVRACKVLRSGSGLNWNWIKLDLELWSLVAYDEGRVATLLRSLAPHVATVTDEAAQRDRHQQNPPYMEATSPPDSEAASCGWVQPPHGTILWIAGVDSDGGSVGGTPEQGPPSGFRSNSGQGGTEQGSSNPEGGGTGQSPSDGRHAEGGGQDGEDGAVHGNQDQASVRRRNRKRKHSPPPPTRTLRPRRPAAEMSPPPPVLGFHIYAVGEEFQGSLGQELERMVAQLHANEAAARFCQSIRVSAERFLKVKDSWGGTGTLPSRRSPLELYFATTAES